MALDGSAELIDLKKRYTKQPIAVLQAYLRAKDKLLNHELPVAKSSGKKLSKTIAAFALNHGLLDSLSGCENRVYRTLLQGLPFQYRSQETIAGLADVSLNTVKRAVGKLETCGLLARHRVPNGPCVFAFTDASALSDVDVIRLRNGASDGLFERTRKRSLIKRVQRTSPMFLVPEPKSSKKEKECSTSSSCFCLSGGSCANCEPVTQSKSDSSDHMEQPEHIEHIEHTYQLNERHNHDQQGSHPLVQAMTPTSCDHTDLTSQAGHITEQGLTCTPFTEVDMDAPENPISSSTGFSDFPESERLFISESPFLCVPEHLRDQAERCSYRFVLHFQDEIDRDLTRLSPMEVCKKWGPSRQLGDLLYKAGAFSERSSKKGEYQSMLEPYIHATAVMVPALCNIALLRNDHPSQIATWIEYAKLKAKSPNGIGGLLCTLMLGAQRVDTAELYPDEAVEFDYFLDLLEIGQDMTRAGVRAKQSLLRDYTGVLHSLVQNQRKHMPGYSAMQIPTLLYSLYDDGDARGLPIRDDAPPQLKVAMVKYMVTQEAERELHPSGEFAYLPHYVHLFRKIAKQEKQAAAAA